MNDMSGLTAVIYARYSSDSQREESIEGQIRECTAFAEKNGIRVLRHYIDRAFSAKTDNRPEFQNMIKDSNRKLFDLVIVWKLDRFARTVVEGVGVIRDLIERGVTVRILNMGTVENTPTGKVTLTVMMAFAEFERDMICERTQTGKAIARANGKRVDGRPKKFPKKYVDEALKRIDNGESYNDVANDTKISKSTLIRAMRERKAQEGR